MLGILFALGAQWCWGIGDFFIQKTTRRVGVWKALFYIGFTASLALLPFVIQDLSLEILKLENFVIFVLATIIALCTALFDFEALKEGKIAIVEPIISLELPLTIGLSAVFLRERLEIFEYFFIFLTFIGITLAVTIHPSHLYYHKRVFERGIKYALVGAVGMALSNLFVGIASQRVSPIFTIWFIHSLLGVISFLYLLSQKEIPSLVQDFKNNVLIVSAQSLLDNAAWVFYALAVSLRPISITVTITEGYIIVAVLLGIIFNREKLKKHQIVGIICALVGVISLSIVGGK